MTTQFSTVELQLNVGGELSGADLRRCDVAVLLEAEITNTVLEIDAVQLRVTFSGPELSPQTGTLAVQDFASRQASELIVLRPTRVVSVGKV